MGKSVAYLLNHWEGLTLFLKDGRVEMDTNLVENQIRPLTLTRKNALFAGHDEGGNSWARLASLIATCKLNGDNALPVDFLRPYIGYSGAAGNPDTYTVDPAAAWRRGRVARQRTSAVAN